MEGTIGEIRLFAGNFAPKNWAYCQGQLLAIQTFDALFSIIGTVYGGDGRTTFGLPNLSGRAVMGTGQGPGLRNRTLGQIVGNEDVQLTINQMPSHSHQAVLTAPGYAGTVKPKALNGKGTQVSDPTGAYMADSPSGTEIYSASTNTVMGESDVTITEASAGAVTLVLNGASDYHNNMQPSLGMNYIICLTGLFPSRN